MTVKYLNQVKVAPILLPCITQAIAMYVTRDNIHSKCTSFSYDNIECLNYEVLPAKCAGMFPLNLSKFSLVQMMAKGQKGGIVSEGTLYYGRSISGS